MPPWVAPWGTFAGIPVVRVSAMASGSLARNSLGLARGGETHRVHDLFVARAAAEVARERLADVRVGRARVALEQLVGRDQEAGGAEAALDGARVDERLLDG